MKLSTLISRGYLKEQIGLHQCGYYGAYSDKWAGKLVALADALHVSTILDYGCGQGKLVDAVREATSRLLITGYDPAVPRFAELPESAELVICTDVLEHIEPLKLPAVLDHLASVTRRWLLTVIATRPATRRLSNGQNAHLIIQTGNWWRNTIQRRGWYERAIPIDLMPVYDPALEVAALWQPPQGAR